VVCHPRIVGAWAFAAERAGGGVVADLPCCLEVAACACGSAFAVVVGLDDAVHASLPHRPMHEARHTAITEFLRDTGDLKLTQMLAGHADIGTTANIYAHLDTTDLETALRARSRRR
jgi:hypothetical protein